MACADADEVRKAAAEYESDMLICDIGLLGESGTDDYITKSFSLLVLVLKIEAYFKRIGEAVADKSEKQAIYSGELVFYI